MTNHFRGILRGEGHEATCTVSGKKVQYPSIPSEVSFPDLTIQNVSKRLPDGNYELIVEGKTIPLKRKNGFWNAGSV
jgi:hypothetical protein